MRRRVAPTIESARLSAPSGGTNAVDPASGMPPTDCVYGYNVIPAELGLRVRQGYQEWCTGLTGDAFNSVRTSLPFQGSQANGTTDRLFATTSSGIWDVTASSPTPTKVLSFASTLGAAGYGIATVAATPAGRFLLYCDEVNGLHIYTESTGLWAKISVGTNQAWKLSTAYSVGNKVVNGANVYTCTIAGTSAASGGPTGAGTGIVDNTVTWDFVSAKVASTIGPSLADQGAGFLADPATFVFVTVFKSRVWFVEANTSRSYYLDVNSIYGTATSFDFGSKMRKGGPLVGLYDWSYDAGNGIDALLVGISSAGDIVVFKGTDPTSADTFSIKGSWSVGGVPAGRTIATDYGGDLLVLSLMGVVPLSRLVIGAENTDKDIYASAKIAPLFARLSSLYGSALGWSIQIHPTENALMVTVPTAGEGQASEQLMMSLSTRGWYYYRGLPVLSAGRFNRDIYFGTADGRICKNSGFVDNVPLADPNSYTSIPYSLLPAFQTLDNARFKQIKMMRPDIISDTPLATCQTTAKYDYDTREPTAPTGSSSIVLPAGHTVDGSTFAVFRFDVAAADGTAQDTAAAYKFTPVNAGATGIYSSGKISNGYELPNGVGLANTGAYLLDTDPVRMAAWRSFFTAADCTIEFWMYSRGLRADNTGGVVFDLETEFGQPVGVTAQFRLRRNEGTGLPSFRWGNSTGTEFYVPGGGTNIYTPADALVKNVWCHVAMVHRIAGAGSVELSINGVKVAENLSAGFTAFAAFPNNMSLGGASGNLDNFDGIIDDMRFSTVARTQAEILADYNKGTGSGPAGWDVGLFDSTTWDAAAGSSQPISGGAGMGRAMSVAIQGNAISRTTIVGVDVLYSEGGML